MHVKRVTVVWVSCGGGRASRRSTLQLSATYTTVVTLHLCIWASSMQKILWATTFACALVPNEGSRGDFGSQRMANARRVLEGQGGHMNKACRERYRPRQLLIRQRGFQRHFAFWIYEEGIKASYRKSFQYSMMWMFLCQTGVSYYVYCVVNLAHVLRPMSFLKQYSTSDQAEKARQNKQAQCFTVKDMI